MATIYQDNQGRSVYNYQGKVIDAKTGQPVGEAPALNTSAPASVGAPSPYQNQPQTLTGFNETVSSVVNLARQKRNKLALETVGSKFAPGTLRASDFGGILENLNRSSDTRVQDMLDTQAESAGQLTSETVGNFEILRDGTGKVISTRSVGSDTQGSEEEKQIQSFYKQAADYILKLDTGDISWAAAWDALRTQYPQASNELLDQVLGGGFDDTTGKWWGRAKK